VPLIQVDNLRGNIGRWFPADVAVVGDATLTAEQLIEAVPARDPADMPLRTAETSDWLASYSMEREFKPEHTPRTMDPRSLGVELNRLLPENRNAVFDSGNFLLITPYISVPGPGHAKQSSDFSSIGMGFGTALGFAVGAPDRPTVLFIGDGSFLMTLGELETVVREDIPLIIVLMNDCAYGAEMHYLKMRNMAVNMSVFPDIDYAPIAAGFGFQAETVRTLDDLRRLAPMLANPEGPIFLDCKVNGAVPAPFLFEAVEFERRKKG
jgi:acetolactate synthase-1/2/3 large subunit